MFEQSILLGEPASKRIGAVSASASAQIIATGVLLLIPLIYTQTLPMTRLPFTLPLPLSQPEQPTTREVKATATSARPNVFRVPFRIPALSPTAAAPTPSVIFDPGAPVVSSGAGTPLGQIDIAQLMPAVERPPESIRPATAAPKPIVTEPLRVSSEIQSAKIIRKVVPVYPPLARQARISGTVKLMGIIAKDGTVQKLQVISGHPLLQKAALDAVSQWLYQPTVLDGQPVEVIAPIDVIFKLSQ